MFDQFNSIIKLLGKSVLLILLLGSVYGSERVVYGAVISGKAMAVQQVDPKQKLIAQVIVQDGKSTDFSGLPILTSSRFVIKSEQGE